MIHAFDAAISLTPQADGRLMGRTDGGYWAFVGPFGGFTAGVLLRAVTQDARAAGDPVALTVNYAAPIAEGPFDVAARLLRANRSTQHWLVELSQGGAEPAAVATVVLAERRESWSHAVAAMPKVADAPPYESPSSANWPGRYRFRFAAGAPDFQGGGTGETRSEVWIADAEPRVLDHASLAAMGDAFFGRIFHAKRGIVPFGTVSMTTHFHVSAAELAEAGDTEVLGVADARTFHRSYGDQTGELWSPSGRLLATTTQVFYFKA